MINYGVVNYVFGAPGTGKSTLLCYLAKWYTKHGFICYVNFDVNIKGCVRISDEDLGYYAFTDGVLLLDELGISMGNRDFKNGMMNDKNRLQFFKRIRHYLQKNKKGCCWVATQGWNDIDKKIRDLSTNYFMITKWFFFTIVKPIHKGCAVDPLSHEPTDFFEIDPFPEWRLVFRPKYYKYFDSFEAPALPEYPISQHVEYEVITHEDTENTNIEGDEDENVD